VVLEGLPIDALGSVTVHMEVVSEAEAILTDREIQVISAASEGLTARQIGRRLGVRERTVTTHLGRIYKKLGANGRVSALSRARTFGLVATGVFE
jgi:DNA-binding CsgD family transcriptional regulator